jgi:C4-type Zn-finger protein
MKTIKTICPYCENEVARHLYFDERGLVETDIKCKCGYHYSDSYGRIEITLPDELLEPEGKEK